MDNRVFVFVSIVGIIGVGIIGCTTPSEPPTAQPEVVSPAAAPEAQPSVANNTPPEPAPEIPAATPAAATQPKPSETPAAASAENQNVQASGPGAGPAKASPQVGVEPVSGQKVVPQKLASLKPLPLGQSRTQMAGCLVSKDGKGEGAPQKRRRSSPVQIIKEKSGIKVVHQLAHACCLKAKVTTKFRNNVVNILETLSGDACRCMCESTLTTTVALENKEYFVVVEVDDRGNKTKVHEQRISLKI
ncbi:MAG: hypothetical protein QNJ97_21640 [Myxococcota bacterium]|nr:hypothetical protein [Myxococcota bacterium]